MNEIGIGAARVLGQRAVVEVHRAGDRVEHDVLEHGPEPAGRGVDLRLGLLRTA